MTASGNWVIQGDTATKVIIQSKGSITSGNYDHGLRLYMESEAKWTQTGSTYANVIFRYLNPESIFQVDNAEAFIGSRTYPTLILNGVNIARASRFVAVVSGDFILTSGASLSVDTAHSIDVLKDVKIIDGTWDISNANIRLYGSLYNYGTIISPLSSIINFNGTGEFLWGTTSIDSAQFAFYGTSSSVFKSGISFGKIGYFNIFSGAVVDLGPFEVGGIGTLSLNSGATLKSGHPSGINGNFTMSGSKNFLPGAIYEFNGTAPQVTGTFLPVSLTGTLRINNSSGVSLTKSTTVTNVEIASGTLDLQSSNLTVANLTITSPSSSKMIIANNGLLRKSFTGNGSFTFPIGDNSGDPDYSPVTVNMTSGTYNNAFVSAKVLYAKHPGNTSTGNYLNRYWQITQAGITNPVYDIDLYYADADVVGDKSDLWGGRWNGIFWQPLSSATPLENKLSGTGLTSFSDFTGGEAGALPVELTSFTAKSQGTTVNLMWETKTEVDNNGFEVERNTSGTWQKIGFVEGHGTANSPKYYNFTDKNATGTKLQYRLKQIDNNGMYEYSPIVEVELNPTQFALYQNYPNPFNPSTVVRYALPVAGIVTIDVFNALGEKVSTLLNSEKEAGYHEVSFDAATLPGGVYFYKIQAGEYTAVKKMVLVK